MSFPLKHDTSSLGKGIEFASRPNDRAEIKSVWTGSAQHLQKPKPLQEYYDGKKKIVRMVCFRANKYKKAGGSNPWAKVEIFCKNLDKTNFFNRNLVSETNNSVFPSCFRVLCFLIL